MKYDKPWSKYNYIAIDTETSGAYPVGSGLVELAAVKWHPDGQSQSEKKIEIRKDDLVTFQTLLNPKKRMSDKIIEIHGITNEMVADAPLIEEKIVEFYDFIQDGIVLAHHAPFDLGFIVHEFEKAKLRPPTLPVICTSLLARNLFPESPNHKLQTLISFFNLKKGVAHRALDDATACLEVGLRCMNKLGIEATLETVLNAMNKKISWGNYNLLNNENPFFKTIITAIVNNKDLELIYSGGSRKDQVRRVTPVGIVRNPDGDYLKALCSIDLNEKRFYINKIKKIIS